MAAEFAPRTFGALLRHNAERFGTMRAVVGQSAHGVEAVTHADAVTHAELDERSRELAARLVAGGVARSSRVGLLAPNSVEWAVVAAAVMRVGAVLVPLSTLLRASELRQQLDIASVTHLVAVSEFRGRRMLEELEAEAPGLFASLDVRQRHVEMPALRAEWQIDALDTALPAPVDGEIVDALEAAVRPASDAVVLFTSGSRGLPKGTIHTHGSILGATAAGLEVRCVGEGEVLYIPMPLFWTGGFCGGLLSALVAPATLLTEAQPEPSATLALLEREGATLFRGWPDQAARLAEHPDFASTDLSLLGDGSLAAVLPTERRPSPGARANLFGMTESGGPYCGDRLDTDMARNAWRSCGRPFVGTEVVIADPETGATLPVGESGEIWLRGPHLMRGICGKTRSEVFTADGFYRTGDLGRLDADGYLFYDRRLDDMFKVSGATVYPSEVEAALRGIPGVRAAAVTAVGEVALGSRQPEVGALVVTSLALDVVRSAVRGRLSAFKVPTRWVLTDDSAAVPLLASGKVDTAALRILIEATAAPE